MPFHFFIIFGSLYRGGQSERFSYKERHQDFYPFFCLGRYLHVLKPAHFCNEREGSGELCIQAISTLDCTVWFNLSCYNTVIYGPLTD